MVEMVESRSIGCYVLGILSGEERVNEVRY